MSLLENFLDIDQKKQCRMLIFCDIDFNLEGDLPSVVTWLHCALFSEKKTLCLKITLTFFQ